MPNERRATIIANMEELKSFILWAKSQRLKSASVDGISFDFSELAFVESLPDEAAAPLPQADLAKPPVSPKLPDGNAQPSEDDELLFWSTR